MAITETNLVAGDYELLTDPDTGAKSIRIPARQSSTGLSQTVEVVVRASNVTHISFSDTSTDGVQDMVISYIGESYTFLLVDAITSADIIGHLFGITGHFYTAIRIIDVPDGRNQYAFISTNRDTRVVGKDEVAGWEFKETTEDSIHNLCITLKTGHTVLIVLGLLQYKAWESSHLGRFSYRYINYDGTVTDDPVFPPEPPADDGSGSTT